VIVNADAIGVDAVLERTPDDARGAAAEDVRIGPVALHAQVHLVAAAHRAAPHVVEAAADQVVGTDAAVSGVDEIEAETVGAEHGLLRSPGMAGPVAELEIALANVAVDFEVRRRRGAVGGRFERVVTRSQQSAVEVEMLGAARLLALDGDG